MSNQIKGKYLKNDQIDGSKILMLNNQPLRAFKTDGSEEELLKLNTNNQLVLLKMPVVSADAEADNELVRKSQLDQVVEAEKTRAEGVENELQEQIDTEKERVDAILLAADADKDTFAEIVQLINSVDTDNDSTFAGYVSSNNAALAQEVSNRIAGDEAQAAALAQEADARAADIADEVAARTDADTALAADIADEETRALAAEEALDAKIDEEIFNRSEAVSAEQSRAMAAEADLAADIMQEASDRAAAVSAEQSRAEGVEEALQDSIDSLSLNNSLTDVTVSSASNGQLLRYVNTSQASHALFVLVDHSSLSGSGMTITVGSVSVTEGSDWFVTEFNYAGTVQSIISAINAASGNVVASAHLDSDKFYVRAAVAGSAGDALGISLSVPGKISTGGATTLQYGIDGVVGWINETPSTSAGDANKLIATDSFGKLASSFLQYNVDFGGNVLSGVSAPSAGTDAANKQWVEGQIGTAEQNSADMLALEISDREAAVSAEQSAREAAITFERASREAADQDLQDQIDALDSGSSQGLAQEILDRQAGDNELDARLDVIEGDDSTEGSVAKAEKDAKDYTDQKVADLVNSAPAVLDTLRELADALGGDQNFASTIAGQIGELDLRLDTVEGGPLVSGSIQHAVAAEQAARESADSDLQTSINQEVSDRQAAVSAEQTAREAAVTNLQSNIDDVDAYAQDIRSDLDDVDAYAQDIRSDLDTLQAQVDALDANQLESRNETFVLTASDISNGYLDLQVNAVLANSVVMFIGRLGFFEGDDFSVGTAPDGKVRVSFSTALKASAEAPEAGDIVRLKYLVQ